MNNTLLARICQEMRQRNTENLLAIWVENDHDVWSEEALAAAKTILVERGITPPPQNAPIKNVPEAQPVVNDELMRWLKAILVLAMIVGTLSEVKGIATVMEISKNIRDSAAFGSPRGRIWLTPAVITQCGTEVGLPLLLLLGVWRCWDRKPTGRVMIVIYAWAALGLNTWYLFQTIHWVFLNGVGLRQVIRITEATIYLMMLQSVLLLFFTRPPIKELFGLKKRGFAVDATGYRQATTPTPAAPIASKQNG
ncbi:MAG TPA: hypothetical protein VHP11_07355 [Tepidisphaeraceae bacterium]|nr:hypothetical protein [Tepidisphaeraceae bacterium]